MCGNPILDISKCWCDLENKGKVTKISSTHSAFPKIYLCNFGQNPSTCSDNNTWKQSYVDTDVIRTKTNMYPLDIKR